MIRYKPKSREIIVGWSDMMGVVFVEPDGSAFAMPLVIFQRQFEPCDETSAAALEELASRNMPARNLGPCALAPPRGRFSPETPPPVETMRMNPNAQGGFDIEVVQKKPAPVLELKRGEKGELEPGERT